MFISTDFLAINFGVDDAIARFFVDREPPPDNLYWHGKLLYLRPAPGYLFIPLMVDLLSKMGIDRRQLLSEKFIGLMEGIGHISALEETKQVSAGDAVQQCMELAKTVCSNDEWHHEVSAYFNNAPGSLIGALLTPFKALHRGDVFLFALCALDFGSRLFGQIAETWFALIGTLLLLDDAEDIKEDTASGDENAFIESGLDKNGIENIKQLLAKHLRTIGTLNKTMSKQLDLQFIELAQRPDISKWLEGETRL